MAGPSRVRASLVELSRRHSRVPHEVEDLAHHLVVSALRRGIALDDEAFLREARGAVRRHAAFLARTAARRRKREAATDPDAGHDDETRESEGHPLSVLSPMLRTTLALLLLGLDKAELRFVLGVSDATLRKRFQALRDPGPLARPAARILARNAGATMLRRSQVRLVPRLATLRAAAGARVLAFSDPDGHGIVVAERTNS